MNVLIVDDEQLVLADMVEMLENIKLVEEIRSFSKSREALAYALENDVDVAILDIDMPGINGLDLAHEILKAHPKADVIFSTGFGEFALDAYRVKASGYLMKPIKKTKLEAELEHIKELRQKQ